MREGRYHRGDDGVLRDRHHGHGRVRHHDGVHHGRRDHDRAHHHGDVHLHDGGCWSV